MSAAATITMKRNGIADGLNAQMTRVKTMQGYFDRVLFRQYQKAQIERWKSENESETGHWTELSPAYAALKPKRFASYPGGGHALMIATGTLSEAAMGRDTSGFYKIATNTGLRVGINIGAIPYAGYAAEARSYMDFSPETLRSMREGISRFIAQGEARVQAAV